MTATCRELFMTTDYFAVMQMYFCQWQLYGAILRDTKFRSVPKADDHERQVQGSQYV